MNKTIYPILILLAASACCSLPLVDCAYKGIRKFNYTKDEKILFNSQNTSLELQKAELWIPKTKENFFFVNLLFQVQNNSSDTLYIPKDNMSVLFQKQDIELAGTIENNQLAEAIPPYTSAKNLIVFAEFHVDQVNDELIEDHELIFDLAPTALGDSSIKSELIRLTIR